MFAIKFGLASSVTHKYLLRVLVLICSYFKFEHPNILYFYNGEKHENIWWRRCNGYLGAAKQSLDCKEKKDHQEKRYKDNLVAIS